MLILKIIIGLYIESFRNYFFYFWRQKSEEIIKQKRKPWHHDETRKQVT